MSALVRYQRREMRVGHDALAVDGAGAQTILWPETASRRTCNQLGRQSRMDVPRQQAMEPPRLVNRHRVSVLQST
jgi:hypothetical protein